MKRITARWLPAGIFLLVAFTSGAQLNLNGLTLNGTSFTYFDPAQINVACSSPVTVTVGTSSQLLVAGDQIRMCPGFSAKTTGSSSGVFRAFVNKDPLDAEVLEPAVLSSVPKYDKVEIGLHLPELETRISNFLTDPLGAFKVASVNYETAADAGIILNPYDPEHISVTATLYPPSAPNSGGIVQNGFYYEEILYVMDPDSPLNWSHLDDWEIDNSNPYEWRIRFSPDEVGEWNGFLSVYVNGILQPQTYLFSFTVIASSNPGFVKVAPNNQYLQYEDGTEFFPVGDNADMATPDGVNRTSGCGSTQCCVTANCAGNYDHRINRKYLDDFIRYMDMMSDQANGGNGGNFTRLLFSPWGMELEWERLGNYQSRQIEMYELDRIFEEAEERHIGLQLCTNNSVEIEPSESWLPVYSNNWNWSPYNNDATDRGSDPNNGYKGITGLTDHLDFYTDPTARKIYKNKLRYISARWGYSTSFLVHELQNEIDQQIGFTTPGHQEDVEAWLSEMSDYIKNNLEAPQLVTVSYLGDGYYTGRDGYVSDIWDDPNIDLINGHNYMARLDGLRLKANETTDIRNAFNKPALFGENDTYYFWMTSAVGRDALHNVLWSSAFNGTFGAGLAWDMRRYMVDDWHDAPGMDVESEYPGLRSFFENMDLVNYTYNQGNTIKVRYLGNLVDSPYENIFLVRHLNGYPILGRDRAYGWVHNRSYNHFTDQDGSAYYDPTPSTWTFGNRVDQPFPSVWDAMNDNDFGPGGSYDPGWIPEFFSGNSYYEGSYNYFFPVDTTTFDPDSLNSFPVYPLWNGTVQITGLYANTNYDIKFYHTVGDLAGTYEPTYDGSFITDAGGAANMPVPPTGGDYPPDWAYVVIQHLGKSANASTSGETSEADETASGLVVAPNPSAGIFRLSGEAVGFISDLEVTDLYGRKVDIRRENSGGTIFLDLGNQPDGVYFIRVNTGNRTIIRKIVKE